MPTRFFDINFPQVSEKRGVRINNLQNLSNLNI